MKSRTIFILLCLTFITTISNPSFFLVKGEGEVSLSLSSLSWSFDHSDDWSRFDFIVNVTLHNSANTTRYLYFNSGCLFDIKVNSTTLKDVGKIRCSQGICTLATVNMSVSPGIVSFIDNFTLSINSPNHKTLPLGYYEFIYAEVATELNVDLEGEFRIYLHIYRNGHSISYDKKPSDWLSDTESVSYPENFIIVCFICFIGFYLVKKEKGRKGLAKL